MLLQSHPTGNAFSRHLAEGLVAADLLSEYWTCLDYPERDRYLRIFPTGWLREARRRQLPASVKPHAHLSPVREIVRLLGNRVGIGPWIRHETSPFSVTGVYQALDQQVARRLPRIAGLQGIYAYEDGAVASFNEARSLGIKTFYDLPIGYWRAARRILGEEAELSPEWASTLRGNHDSPAKLARKDQELALADTVIVASSFTRKTLTEAPVSTGDIVQVPYGAPSAPASISPLPRRPDQALKVLFVGSLGQRKGLRYLLEAMEQLGAGFELTLIGTPPGERCDPLAAGLRRHRHISSLPHSGILAEMQQHHVFVFPSLFEGFGLVLLEAMACALPIIATPHTAAPDIITHGVEGFIIPIRSATAIAQHLTALRENEDQRLSMAHQALDRARTTTWHTYQRNLIAQLQSRLLS